MSKAILLSVSMVLVAILAWLGGENNANKQWGEYKQGEYKQLEEFGRYCDSLMVVSYAEGVLDGVGYVPEEYRVSYWHDMDPDSFIETSWERFKECNNYED